MADTVIARHAAHAAEELGDERRRRAPAPRARNDRWRVVAKRSHARAGGRTIVEDPQRARGDRRRRIARRSRYVTTPIGTTPVAWRADSARVVDTPLIDFILEVERKRAGRAARVDGRVLARRVARRRADHRRRDCRRSIRTTTRCARCGSPGAQLRAYLEQSARYFAPTPTAASSVDPAIPGLQLRHRRRASTTRSTCRSRSASASRARVQGPSRCADRHVHAGAEQLSADGRRRLLDAARRAGGLRPAAGDPPAADRRSAARRHASPGRLFSSQLAHRAGRRRSAHSSTR